MIMHITKSAASRNIRASRYGAFFHVCMLLLFTSLASCTTTKLELPTCDIPEPLSEVQALLDVPAMPVEIERTETAATYDLQGVLQLDRVFKTAESNKVIGDLNTAALSARNEEVNAFIECARYSKMWMEVREDMLEQERRDHTIDNLFHRGILVLIGLASL